MLNSAHYGVPQARERVFLVGSRDGTDFIFPERTHVPKEVVDLFDNREPYRTAWDAIGDLPENPDETSLVVGGRWGDLLPTIPEGQNYLWHTNRLGGENLFGWRTRYWSFLLKLAKDQPSWTIQAQPGSAVGPFHWKNRKLTIQEMCRIQTFPDELRFDCGRTDVQKLVGNAVPSLMAEVLGRAMRSQLLASCPEETQLRLLLPKSSYVPPPEQTVPEPAKYMTLVADHKDHPGTKKD